MDESYIDWAKNTQWEVDIKQRNAEKRIAFKEWKKFNNKTRFKEYGNIMIKTWFYRFLVVFFLLVIFLASYVFVSENWSTISSTILNIGNNSIVNGSAG